MSKSSAQPLPDSGVAKKASPARKGPAAPEGLPPKPSTRAPRLKHEDRKQLILEQATQAFAEKGFDLSTPELARRLGIAQSLLYRYYKTKQELIEAVYAGMSPGDELYHQWEAELQERAVPLRTRLVRFYKDYAHHVWPYKRVRIIMWANLLKPELNRPYYEILQSRFFPLIAREIRYAAGLDYDGPLSEQELEMVRSMHGAMYHMGAIRRWIHVPPSLEGDIGPLIELKVGLFLRVYREALTWG